MDNTLRQVKAKQRYTVRKNGDNYALCFDGQIVELFANKKTAEKYMRLSQSDRNRTNPK